MDLKQRKKNDEELIHDLIDQWTFAICSKNAKAAGEIVGEKGMDEWFDSFKGNLNVELHDFEIAIGDNEAFSHCLCHLTGLKRTDELLDIWFRKTIGYQKQNGDWKIVHEHDSLPMLNLTCH